MIPKIVHHVWPGSDTFKQKFHSFRKSWMEHHPDWTFYFWRLDNLPTDIDPRVSMILNNPAYSITVKSDILRFEIVGIFGGIYVDTDMECLKPIDSLLTHRFFCGEEDNSRICPSIFGTTANNEVLKEIKEHSLYSISTTDIDHTNRHPDAISGVVPFTNVLRTKGTEQVAVYSPEYFYPIHYSERHRLAEINPVSYTKHYWSGMDSEDGWTNVIKF